MKVPKYIKDAIIRTAKANYVANKNDKIVLDWIQNKNIYEEVIDSYIDCCEYGVNVPEAFINILEGLEDKQ